MENTIKQSETQAPEKGKVGRRKSRRKQVDDYLRFLVFLVLIGLVYIWNAHLAEKQIIKEDLLKKEVKNLRLHYISIESELAEQKKPSSVADSTKDMGLRLLTQAPYQLKKER